MYVVPLSNRLEEQGFLTVRFFAASILCASMLSVTAASSAWAQQQATQQPAQQPQQAPTSPTPQMAPASTLDPMRSIREQAELAAQALQAANAQVVPQQQQQVPVQQLQPQPVLPMQMSAQPPVQTVIALQPVTPAPSQDQLMPAEQALAEANAAAQKQAEDKNAAEVQDEQAVAEADVIDANADLMPEPSHEEVSKALPDSPPATNNKGIVMDLEPALVNDTGEYSDAMQQSSSSNSDVETLSYEEQLRIRTKEIEQRAQSQAFEQLKRTTLPMETYQIRDLLRRLKDTQEAIQKPVRVPPKPQNVIKTISVDPAVPSEVVHLAVGNVTALNVVDMTGAPWPIVDIAFGGQFDVKAPDAGGSIVRITPLRDFARGNMVVRLLRMTTPITFTLEAGGSVVNYRFDARIPQYGPNARMPIVQDGNQTVAGDTIINSILEGIAPAGSEKLAVQGLDGRTSAYRMSGMLYVRTPHSLLSPAWRGSATSADGMNVYVLAEAPVLLLSDQGKLVRAHISTVTSDVGVISNGR